MVGDGYGKYYADFICPCCGAALRLSPGWNLVRYGSNATGQCYHSITPNTGPSPHYFSTRAPVQDEEPEKRKYSWSDDTPGPWDASPQYRRWQTSRARRNPKRCGFSGR